MQSISRVSTLLLLAAAASPADVKWIEAMVA
jgi:hypothetical protein